MKLAFRTSIVGAIAIFFAACGSTGKSVASNQPGIGMAGSGGDASTDAGDGSTCFACEPPAGGWAFVGVASTSTTTCPPGYATKDLVTADVSNVSCPCHCGVKSYQDCWVGGATTITEYPNGTCGPQQWGPITPQSHCSNPTPGSNVPGNDAWTWAPAPANGSCNPPDTKPKGSAAKSTTHTCEPPAGDCKLCTAGVSGLRTCVWKAGTDSCPQGFPDSIQAGSDVADTTCTCGACTFSRTCTGTVYYYSQQLCNTTPLATVPVDGKCHSTGTTAAWASWQFDSSTKASCSGAPGTPSATLTDPVTICCRN